MTSVLWTPPKARKESSNMAAFIRFVNARRGLALPYEYAPLYRWSLAAPAEFWRDVWEFTGIVGEAGARVIADADKMPGARFFPDGRLNYAENLLQNADARAAIIAWDESGRRGEISRETLRAQTLRLAGWLRAQGVGRGDCVGAVMPNTPETVIALLATAAVGGVFSSCSPDFGADGVVDRLGQIAPKILVAARSCRYGGRRFSRRGEIGEARARMPSVRRVLVAPSDDDDAPADDGETAWDEALAHAPTEFSRGGFNDALAVLYSSGTTGAPKCIVHGGGGTLLQHAKEHALHADIRAGDRVFYYTTCGWMMWNWLVGALAREAAIVLYEGNPMTPHAAALWDMAEAEDVAVFGASAKYFDAQRKAKVAPRRARKLPALRAICSTGSPLLAEGFAYIYADIKSDVHLASISGGTDIVSCFVLGNPFDAVRAGDIQGAGLGMAVDVLDDAGKPQTDKAGELVCTAPFPSMPLGFWRDADGAKYRAAYFEKHPGIWTHGDWATRKSGGAFVIHGRSDTTLNPGGVRIGTAEIYRHVEKFDAEIAEAAAVQHGDDIILFVRPAAGVVMDDALRRRLAGAIRHGASPRHVPARIIAAADLPRTRSGKVSETAIRAIMHGQSVKNMEALANPESLAHIKNALAGSAGAPDEL